MPLFLAIDEEGGTVAHIGNNSNFIVKKYSDMNSIGATKDSKKAYEVGDTIGSYLHEYGLNLDFAPDADVLTNPNNTVIGNRSFGNDANLVAKMDVEAARGLADNQVLSCFKHFPGHGATEGDTHEGYAYTTKTLGELKKSELVPFQAAVDNHIPFIMISHISVPNVIGNNTPSTLSKVMITDILRNQMGYDGIIITDAMRMGAIVNNYSTKDAVIKSIEAGADIILMPQNFEEAYQGVLDAVADGTISEQRINESLERILRVKLNMGI
jgi:beta-N-acetylhexosaminidase